MHDKRKAYYHLPGLFEFYELYKKFLQLYRNHREYFYDWCEIGSIYGAPADCIWGGGRVGFGDATPEEVAELMKEYGISARLTFSNSLISEVHLKDKKCNRLCELFGRSDSVKNGIIIYSDLLMDYIIRNYPDYYFVSSTTKVLTSFDDFKAELERREYSYVVPDFRLNKRFDELNALTQDMKDKVEFLCNECCAFDCNARRSCYENVSRKALGEECIDHICISPNSEHGYRITDAMKNPGFIGIEDIKDAYLSMGFKHFKIEGRSLGSAVVFELLLYYMVKPEWQLKMREEVYLDSSLDLF